MNRKDPAKPDGHTLSCEMRRRHRCADLRERRGLEDAASTSDVFLAGSTLKYKKECVVVIAARRSCTGLSKSDSSDAS